MHWQTLVIITKQLLIKYRTLYHSISYSGDADRIVIAAPFWDMSYPSALKNFLELCSIFNVTFKSDDTTCYGNCKAEKLLYITTRGMDISTGDPLEQATPYLKALSWLWGIGPMDVIATQNMDYV